MHVKTNKPNTTDIRIMYHPLQIGWTKDNKNSIVDHRDCKRSEHDGDAKRRNPRCKVSEIKVLVRIVVLVDTSF